MTSFLAMVLDIQQRTGRSGTTDTIYIKSAIVDAINHVLADGVFPDQQRQLVITTVADQSEYSGSALVTSDDWVLKAPTEKHLWYAESDGGSGYRYICRVYYVHPSEYSESLIGATAAEVAEQPDRWTIRGKSLWVYPAPVDSSHYLILNGTFTPPAVGKKIVTGAWQFTDTTDDSDLGSGDVEGDLFSVKPGGAYYCVMHYAHYLFAESHLSNDEEAGRALNRYAQARAMLSKHFFSAEGPRDVKPMDLASLVQY